MVQPPHEASLVKATTSMVPATPETAARVVPAPQYLPVPAAVSMTEAPATAPGGRAAVTALRPAAIRSVVSAPVKR